MHVKWDFWGKPRIFMNMLVYFIHEYFDQQFGSEANSCLIGKIQNHVLEVPFAALYIFFRSSVNGAVSHTFD